MHASLFEGFYLERDVLFIDLIGDTIKKNYLYKLPLRIKFMRNNAKYIVRVEVVGNEGRRKANERRKKGREEIKEGRRLELKTITFQFDSDQNLEMAINETRKFFKTGIYDGQRWHYHIATLDIARAGYKNPKWHEVNTNEYSRYPQDESNPRASSRDLKKYGREYTLPHPFRH